MWVKEKAHRHQRANVVMACREVSKLTEIQSLTRDREIFILFISYFLFFLIQDRISTIT